MTKPTPAYLIFVLTTALSSCKVLPIGAKPCGGPWGNLVFSVEMSDENQLRSLIERYDELDQIRNKEEKRVSTCDVASPPALSIKDGSCHGDRYAWNPGDMLRINDIPH